MYIWASIQEPLDRSFDFAAVSLTDEPLSPTVGMEHFVGLIGHEGLSNAHVTELREQGNSVGNVEGKVVEIVNNPFESSLELGLGDNERLK